MAIRGLPFDYLPAPVGDGEMVCILEDHERVDDAKKLAEFAERMRASGRKVGYMPHYERNGSTTYRARLFVGPLPERIFDYVGPTRDVSRAAGFLAYRGMLAENCYTSQSKKKWDDDEVAEALRKGDGAPHLLLNRALFYRDSGQLEAAGNYAHQYLETNELGDGRAMALTIIADTYKAGKLYDMAFAYYAQASVMSPLPEAILGMAKMGDPRDFLDRVDQAWDAADRRMDFWPWSPDARFVEPGRQALRRALREEDPRVRDYIDRLQEHGEEFPVEDLYACQEKAFVVEPSPVLSVLSSLEMALAGAGHEVAGDGNTGWQYFASQIDQVRGGTSFCPQEPLDGSIETIRRVMAAREILVMSDFQRDQLKRTLPFVPDHRIRRVRLGHNTVLGEPKQELIAIGTGSDHEVVQDILQRVSFGGVRFGVQDATPSALKRAKIWLYAGTDERVPLAPVELLEAQSAGAVPVCVGTGAIPEYVIRGFFYKPPVTAEAFKAAAAKRIIELLSDEGERLSVATAHDRRMRALHWDRVVDEWIK